MTKPPIPGAMFADWPRIPVAEDDDGPFARVLRIGARAGSDWMLGPDGPYKHPEMTAAQATRGAVREALLHLLELGIIDVDVERLESAAGFPFGRSDCRPTDAFPAGVER